jgi:hypothetical protein
MTKYCILPGKDIKAKIKALKKYGNLYFARLASNTITGIGNGEEDALFPAPYSSPSAL